MSLCICTKHAVRMDCPVHGNSSYRDDFHRLMRRPPSVLDDPAAKAADHADWDRRKKLAGGDS